MLNIFWEEKKADKKWHDLGRKKTGNERKLKTALNHSRLLCYKITQSNIRNSLCGRLVAHGAQKSKSGVFGGF